MTFVKKGAPHGLERGKTEILRERRHCKGTRGLEQRLLVRAIDMPRDDRDTRRDTETPGFRCEIRGLTIGIAACDHDPRGGQFGQRANQPVQPLLPADPPERQNHGRSCDRRRDIGGRRRVAEIGRIVDAVRDGHHLRQFPAEALEMARLDFGSRVDRHRAFGVAALDQVDPCRLDQPVLPPDQLGYQHAPGRQDVGHAVPSRGALL